ncbi:hypothetical protein VTJ04DRAFT_4596 [Mycothermus thermophilus]|uniref:uncharacterized protein n=1 Tax=Humicola insolens TaxID=85995 RepID=UPI00374304B0
MYRHDVTCLELRNDLMIETTLASSGDPQPNLELEAMIIVTYRVSNPVNPSSLPARVIRMMNHSTFLLPLHRYPLRCPEDLARLRTQRYPLPSPKPLKTPPDSMPLLYKPNPEKRKEKRVYYLPVLLHASPSPSPFPCPDKE